MDSATTRKPVEIRGRGLFTGEPCLLRIDPAEYGSGLAFRSSGVRVPALASCVVQQAANFTLLEHAGQQVRVTEHLLCALWAAGVDTAEIVLLDGPELPNIDGSALPFYSAITSAGRQQFNRRRKAIINGRLQLGDENAYFILEPSTELAISYHFSHPELGAQEFDYRAVRESAVAELLPARTFATLPEIQAAQAAGVMLNDDETAGLLIRDGVPNQPLRFANEFARHKVLDLIGDMYLLPFDWPCRVTAYRTGHALNHQLAALLLKEVDSGQVKLL